MVTPEPSPLAVFGQAAGKAVSRLLEDAGITVYASAVAEVLEVAGGCSSTPREWSCTHSAWCRVW